MTDKILVVDDDASLLRVLEYNLEQEGYKVVTANNGREAMHLTYTERPNLLILDIMMPGLDGWEVCQRVREMSDAPIIMLTAKELAEDVVKGLDLGADDYIVKPFIMKELLARVRAALRRARVEAGADEKMIYRDDYLSIDLKTQRVTANDALIDLTPTEYRVLALLVKSRGRVIKFRQILEHVWGFEYVDEVSYVHTYIWRLRRKIEPDPKIPRYLLSTLDVGYRFESQRARLLN
jgi:two-component system KDP operon response regulator KdpE